MLAKYFQDLVTGHTRSALRRTVQGSARPRAGRLAPSVS